LKVKCLSEADNKIVEQTKNYEVIPKDLEKENNVIVPNNKNSTIKVSRRPVILSPINPLKN